ncbi:MAG TPA: helix-turn-helix domain-containing protein [Mycobacteriales bacterium]|nr:helix-turn-helix domain-containing protein [Mycobacteriales bacterium]
MAGVKDYGQFCALARALDQIGDRWTLLVVRELLLGPATYSQLQRALPGVATNLLADRLRDMAADGIVEREVPGGARSAYLLTSRGSDLRPVVHALVRWGGPLMGAGPAGDVVDERWLGLALEALLTTSAYDGELGRARVRCGGVTVDVVAAGRSRRVEWVRDESQGDPGAPDVAVTGSLPDVLAAAYRGRLPAGLRVKGSRRLARTLLSSAP